MCLQCNGSVLSAIIGLVVVHPANSTPSQSPTTLTPKLIARANDGQRITQQVNAQAAAFIGTMAFRLTN
jgi:hypothetical protein